MPNRVRAAQSAVLAAAGLVLASCGTSSAPVGVGIQHSPPPSASSSARRPVGAVPRPAHTVVVILENHSYGAVIGSPQASYINALARSGALFTASYAVSHPSEPNYLALFSGSTHGITSDQCPTTLRAPNLAGDLLAKGISFAGYAEGLPGTGSQICQQGSYARKHVPWADFTGLPRTVNQPFSRFAAGGFARLPAVSFVIPDLCHDMHDCSVGTGDAWLRAHLSGYARWAQTHDSLLIVTFDEDDGSNSNHIATIMSGQQVRPGRYHTPIDHYNVLRTIEQAYDLPFRGQARTHFPITSIWRRGS
ncbi:MAG TPA: alkaline phosphatase family protein [Streptosporangiaceae bacterium]